MITGLPLSETETPESLFHQLYGDRSDREVKLSKAFAMCFRESPVFANAVLHLLHKTCDASGPTRGSEWRCDTEVAFSKGRPDIEIHAPGVMFRLESKVGAQLTKGQLLRYRFKKRDRKYLLALTKRPPEVSRAWMDKKHVFSIRWQDVHRAVAKARARGRDRYLRDSFCLYLEELGMAHREDVRPDDLKQVYDLLDTIATQRKRYISAQHGFEVADSCLHLLREVARQAREELPSLNRWGRMGPFYVKQKDDRERYYHRLGFCFQRKRGKDKIGAGFSFRQNGRWARWEVWRMDGNKGTDKRRLSMVKQVCAKSGALDRGQMLRSFVSGARALGIKK